MEIRIDTPIGKAPLFCQFDGQCQPQPAYLQLNANGYVFADYSGDTGGGVPASVWHGVDRRIALRPTVSGKALREYLGSEEFRALLDRYYAGAGDKWDGSNFVGTASDDALEALNQIEQDADNLECVNIFSADDWVEYATREELAQHGGDFSKYAEYLDGLCDIDQIVEGGAAAIAKALEEKFAEEDE